MYDFLLKKKKKRHTRGFCIKQFVQFEDLRQFTRILLVENIAIYVKGKRKHFIEHLVEK